MSRCHAPGLKPTSYSPETGVANEKRFCTLYVYFIRQLPNCDFRGVWQHVLFRQSLFRINGLSFALFDADNDEGG